MARRRGSRQVLARRATQSAAAGDRYRVVPTRNLQRCGTAVADPRVKLITFTGSDKVGRILAVEAAKHFKRFVLELGGKNPFIVLKDADLNYAVDCAAFGIYMHQGQVCMASSRIIVEDPVYDEFCAKFVAKTRTIKVGDPRDPSTVIGPIIRKSHCAFVDAHIQDAVAKGARLLTGGTHDGPFYVHSA